MRPRIWLIAAAAALAGVACSSAAAPTAGPPPASPPGEACTPRGLLSEGEALPDCTFENVRGGDAISLRALRGTPLVLNFWASWCTFCIKEMPDFQAVSAALNGRVTFLGMDMLGIEAETREAAVAFALRTGVRYPLAYDTDGMLYGHFNTRVRKPPLPLTVLVDADGVVRRRHFGPLTEEALRNQIAESLGVS